MSLLCCAALLAVPMLALAEKQVPVTPLQSAMPMLPHLEWLLDSGGTLGVEDMGMPRQQAAFRPLNLANLPREAGTVWLRFTLAGRPVEVRPATLLLDMGEGVPDTPTLFVPKHNLLSGTTEWQSFSPSQRSVFLMPETRGEPVTAYIRMDGLPGLWFSPMLRTPHNAATALERLTRPAVIVALAVVMLLCLLRGLTERGEWRIWTSVYTGAALFHAVWGVPATSNGHVNMLNMAAVLAPGVGLMILPHVGRHLLRTRQVSRSLDLQLFLLSLPGAALALVPLLPGFSWTSRFLDLWPAGALLLVPTTVSAWLSGLPGARRFLLGCLLPPLGVAVGLLGMGTSIPAPVLATAPLWGLALGALIIAGTAAPQEYREQKATAEAPLTLTAQDLVDEDPNLRIVSPEELAQQGSAPALSTPGDSHALALEENLRAPLDELLRDGAALAQCSLPPAARQLAESMLQSVHRMASTLAGGPADSATRSSRVDVMFDLQEVLRQAHDSVSGMADSKGIALSWFMPPHLGQRYRGGAGHLGEVLCLLLESAVRATSRGAVQIAVRRVPESINPGHLLFSVTDTGTGMPPQERSSLALARAWELAGANRGFLGVESSPHGATISFTLHLEPQGAEAADEHAAPGHEQPAQPGIIVTADNSGERQLLAFFLEGLGAVVVEARSADEAVDLYMDRPADLLVFDGDLPAAALSTAVQRIRVYEKAQDTAAALIMGLSSNDGQWEDMRAAGFTHALPKPITRGGLRSTVCQLLPQCTAQEMPAPEADLSQSLPPLPLPEQTVAEEDEIIETGLPLLEMDSAPALHERHRPEQGDGHAPAAPSEPENPAPDLTARHQEPAEALSMAPAAPADAAAPLSMEPAAPPAEQVQQGSSHPAGEQPPVEAPQASPAAVPDLFATGGDLPAPRHHSVDAGSQISLLGGSSSTLLGAPDAPPLSFGTGTAHRGVSGSMPDLLNPAPPVQGTLQVGAGKSHEDYLKSLLDSDDSLLKPETSDEPAASASPAAEVTTASTAAEASDTPAEAQEQHNAGPESIGPESIGPEAATPSAPAQTDGANQTDGTNQSEEPAQPRAVSGTVKLTIKKALRKVEQASASEKASEKAASELPRSPAPSSPLREGGEWVGEPQPIGSPVSASTPTQEAAPLGAARAPAVSAGATEWVGEPQPIGSPVQSAPGADTPPSAPSPAHSASPGGKEEPVHQPFVVGSAARTALPENVEWVGEPRPVEKAPVPVTGADMAPEAHPPASPADLPHAEAAATPLEARAAQEMPAAFTADTPFQPGQAGQLEQPAEASLEGQAFVPLSMHATATEPAHEEAGRAEKARPSLLPQGTPLMDFIIAEPAAPEPPVASAPSAPAVASVRPVDAPARPERAERRGYGSVGEPTPVAKPAASISVKNQDLPLAQLLDYFDQSVRHARLSFEKRDTDGVHEAAAFIARQADTVGLRTLARMARCVADAGKAGDLDAVKDLLPELEGTVERNRIALGG